MNVRKIVFCYRKIIDAQKVGWERMLHEDTFKEFKLQFQLFNTEKKYTRFSELLNADTRAEKLHFLVSAAARGYILQLRGKVPDIKNKLGRTFLSFSNFQFEIIESGVDDIRQHVVAVSFCTDPLIWYSTIGDDLLLTESMEEPLMIQQLQLQPFLSIYSIQNIQV